MAAVRGIDGAGVRAENSCQLTSVERSHIHAAGFSLPHHVQQHVAAVWQEGGENLPCMLRREFPCRRGRSASRRDAGEWLIRAVAEYDDAIRAPRTAAGDNRRAA